MVGTLVDGCPFGDDICLDNTAYTVESDWIHSDQHLGINTEPNDRMRMQIRKTCSPLTSDGYLKHYDSSNISMLLPPTEFSWEREPYRSYLTAGHKYGAFFYGPPISKFASMNGAQARLFASSLTGLFELVRLEKVGLVN